MHRDVDVAIVGAGTAGLSALSQVRKVTDNFVLINGGALGTTCARVGCMPSKAAIQVAEDFHRRGALDRCGIEGGQALSLDVGQAMEHVRDLRDIFVDRVLAGSTDELAEDQLLEGYARFVEPNVLEVEGRTIRAKRIVIATGSCPYVPPEWERFSERILTTDELFEQERLPESVAVIGLGVIGLEMGQTLHRMGVQVTGIDRLQTIGGLKDPPVSEAAVQAIGGELTLWLGHEARVEPAPDGRLQVSAGEHSTVVDKLLVSMGRVPNVQRLDLARLGVALDERGIPVFDRQTMQVGELPVFIAGDVTGERPILHEAGDEGRIAGYNAVHEPVARFRRKTALAITFCDPTIATVGRAWDELDPDKIAVGEVRLGPVGRALIMGKNKGMIRLYADRSDGRLLGAALASPRGENLAHLIAWSIQQGLTVADLLKMPYYHPTIEEALQGAVRNLHRALGMQDELPELGRLAGTPGTS